MFCALGVTLWLGSAAAAANAPYVQLGSFAAGAGVLGVAVDQSSNDVYVATGGTAGVAQQWSSSGTALATVGNCGGLFTTCAGVAVDPVSRDVYVYNATANTILTFHNTGGSQWSQTASFAVSGPKGAFVQIATDAAGDVYYPNQTADTVQEFDSSGNLLNTFSGNSTVGVFTKPQGVAVDSNGDVFVVDAGRVVEIAGSGGQPDPNGSESVFDSDNSEDVSVDPVTNDVFVLDLDGTSCGSLASPCYHVVGYHSDGSQFADFGAGTIANKGAGDPPDHLAVDDATGNVYVSDYQTAVWIFSPHVPPTATTGQASNVAATSATLNGTVNPNGTDTAYSFEYGLTTGYGQESSNSDAGAGTAEVPVSGNISGLQPNQTYHYQLVATSQGGTANGGDSTFTTAPVPPSVGAEASADVTQTDAVLEAQVNANNEDTHDYFEESPSPLGGCPSTAAQTGTDIGSRFASQSVSQLVGSLGPSTVYHYRVVAYNGTGVTCGPDQTFQTLAPAQQAAARAYELVSSDPGMPQDLNHDQWMEGLSPDGQTVFLEAYRGAAPQYFAAVRGASGWQMTAEPTAANPSLLFGGANDGTAFFAAAGAGNPTPTYVYSTGATGPVPVARDPAGANVDISDVALGSSDTGSCIGCAISADGAHFVFQAHGALTAGANGSVANVYESDAQGNMTLVSVPSAGDPAPPTAYGSALGANYGAGTGNDVGQFRLVNFPNAISADGSRVYFSSAEQLDPSMPDDGQPHLYLRNLATQTTTLVSKSQVPGSQADSIVTGTSDLDATFGGATPNGSEAFFLSTDQLTSDAPAVTGKAHLYEYDATTGKLSYVARAADGSASTGTQAFVAVSDDGSHVFFTDTAQLTADAPDDSTPKLYVRDLASGGSTRYIAEVSPDPSGSQVSTDGSTFLFQTGAALTADDTDSQVDVYEWRAGQGLSLISKGSSGGNLDTTDGVAAIGAVSAIGNVFAFPSDYDEGIAAGLSTAIAFDVNAAGGRALSADGSWAFFSSREQLTPDASAAPVWKIYGYHDGELSLISPPGSDQDAYFRDSSPNGSDVYFETREALVPGVAGSGSMELYDARIGGGFPTASPPVNACPDNACDAPAPAPPSPAATVGFAGPGNVTATAPPSTPKVRLTKKSVSGSTVLLSVKVPAAGRIAITGAGVKTVRKLVSRAGTYRLRDALTANNGRILKRKGKLRLKLKVAYTPTAGTPSTAAVTLTMKSAKVKAKAVKAKAVKAKAVKAKAVKAKAEQGR